MIGVSVTKHGADTPLTLGHLYNICKLARKFEEKIEVQVEKEDSALLNEIFNNGQN